MTRAQARTGIPLSKSAKGPRSGEAEKRGEQGAGRRSGRWMLRQLSRFTVKTSGLWSTTRSASTGLALVLACLAPLGASTVLGATPFTRFALCIGNESYLEDALRGPAPAARTVCSALRTRGFHATIALNAGHDKMEKALNAFLARLNHRAIGFLFYSGHGIQVQRKSYMLPIDVVPRSPADVQIQGWAIEEILQQMQVVGTPAGIVALDACQKVSYFRDLAPQPEGLVKTVAPPWTYLALSAAPEQNCPSKGKKRFSVYADALAKALMTADLEIDEIFAAVEKEISEATKGRQRPYRSDGIPHDLYLSGSMTRSSYTAQAAASHSIDCPTPQKCYELGEIHYFGKKVPKDLGKAARYYELACNGGDARGCGDLGLLYATARGVKRNLPLAVQLYAKGCNGGFAHACTRLGLAYQKGMGASKSGQKAVIAFEKGCKRDPSQCTYLGFMYERGVGTEKNAKKAAQLYEAACEAKSALGCRNIGLFYNLGTGVFRNYIKAVAFYREACKLKKVYCTYLGYMYDHGQGVEEDDQRAADLYAKSCGAGDARGCASLGTLYENGNGVPQDLGKAAKSYERSCGLAESHCTYLGLLYEQGMGVSKDASKAVQHYRKACDAGDTRGCANLGKMQELGKGTEKNRYKAIASYAKACKKGSEWACKQAKRLR